MTAKIYLLRLFLAAGLLAGAALYTSGTLSGTTIPDNNTLGTEDAMSYIFNQPDSVITDVVLTFALQGGISSDLSGYLRLGNTVSSPFYDLSTLIQGLSLSPSSATTYTIDFNTSGFHDAFNGLNPNNTWTLFFADSVNGDMTMVNSWSLNITAGPAAPVPEPVNVAMAAFAVVVVAAGGVRQYLKARNCNRRTKVWRVFSGEYCCSRADEPRADRFRRCGRRHLWNALHWPPFGELSSRISEPAARILQGGFSLSESLSISPVPLTLDQGWDRDGHSGRSDAEHLALSRWRWHRIRKVRHWKCAACPWASGLRFIAVEQKENTSILIVDDRRENLLALHALLADLGHNIVEAQSGREALKLILRQEFSLVLLDVNMPMMDGFETGQYIRKRQPADVLPILFISAREPSDEDRRRGYSIGAVDYVTKPIIPEVLRAKVTALIGLQRRARSLETVVRQRTSEIEELNARAAKLRQSIAELEAFSYTLSHDMKAPLRAILLFAQLVREDHGEKLPDEAKDYLRRITSSAVRLDQMISDVLAYTRLNLESLTFRIIDVEELVGAVIEQHPRMQPPEAEIEIQKPLLNVLGHEASLRQCMDNLLNNAVKFVAPQVKPRVKIWTEPVGAEVRIGVEDNGIGIAPEDQKRLFAEFERLGTAQSYEGTGLGLAIVRRAVERMSGKLGIESEVGQGSRFWIQLPKGRPEDAMSLAGTSAHSTQQNSAHHPAASALSPNG